MRMLRFTAEMGESIHVIRRTHEELIAHLDSAQWASAGVELGRLTELAGRLAATCRLARDALAEDAWVAAQAEEAAR